LIIRSLLTIEDYAKYIGFAGSGSKYYFGVDNKWEILLTKNNQNDMEDYTDYLGLFYQFFKKYKSIKDEFLDYDSNEILEQLILDYLNNKGNIN
ncbi:SigF, partial [Campylobacter jejuni]